MSNPGLTTHCRTCRGFLKPVHLCEKRYNNIRFLNSFHFSLFEFVEDNISQLFSLQAIATSFGNNILPGFCYYCPCYRERTLQNSACDLTVLIQNGSSPMRNPAPMIQNKYLTCEKQIIQRLYTAVIWVTILVIPIR